VTADLRRIAATLGFTMEELALNRAGALSHHQSWEAVKRALGMGGLTLMLFVSVLAMVYVVRGMGRVRFLYYGLGFGGLLLFALIGWRSVVGAVKQVVLSAEGTLDMHGTGKGMVAVIGRARVLISTDARQVLSKGGRYRIFYLSDANSFLSIEPAPAAPP
jgi:hypothetical protein